MTEKQTTRICTVCGNTNLVELREYEEKVCIDHNPYVRIPWYLEEGQQPLFGKIVKKESIE